MKFKQPIDNFSSILKIGEINSTVPRKRVGLETPPSKFPVYLRDQTTKLAGMGFRGGDRRRPSFHHPFRLCRHCNPSTSLIFRDALTWMLPGTWPNLRGALASFPTLVTSGTLPPLNHSPGSYCLKHLSPFL